MEGTSHPKIFKYANVFLSTHHFERPDIEVFDDRQRRHSTLGYFCLAEYEKQKDEISPRQTAEYHVFRI